MRPAHASPAIGALCEVPEVSPAIGVLCEVPEVSPAIGVLCEVPKVSPAIGALCEVPEVSPAIGVLCEVPEVSPAIGVLCEVPEVSLTTSLPLAQGDQGLDVGRLLVSGKSARSLEAGGAPCSALPSSPVAVACACRPQPHGIGYRCLRKKQHPKAAPSLLWPFPFPPITKLRVVPCRGKRSAKKTTLFVHSVACMPSQL